MSSLSIRNQRFAAAPAELAPSVRLASSDAECSSGDDVTFHL
jgi:hypothetical protein